MNITIEDKAVRGMLDKLIKAGYGKEAALMIASRVHELTAPYAPSTAANRVQLGTTHYQRGLGSVYTRIGGGRTVRKTSEMLGRKWDVVQAGNGARLSNTASYAGYVHDEAYQTDFHKKRGWETWQGSLRRMKRGGDINKIIEEIFDGIL